MIMIRLLPVHSGKSFILLVAGLCIVVTSLPYQERRLVARLSISNIFIPPAAWRSTRDARTVCNVGNRITLSLYAWKLICTICIRPGKRSITHRYEFRYGLINGEDWRFDDCDFEWKTGIVEPRQIARGNIARAMLYMHSRYDIPVEKNALVLFKVWNRIDPPSKQEKVRNDIIERLQGKRNLYIDRPSIAEQSKLTMLKIELSTQVVVTSMKIESLINDLVENRNIEVSDLQTFFAELCDGAPYPPEQLASLLVLLRARGETAEQLAGIAEVLLERALPVDIPGAAVCLCGTGGDNSGSFNISTTASLLVAACGVPVAKHGSRSVTSKSGSADVLEELGIATDLGPERAAYSLENYGFAFLSAQIYHPSFKNISPVRKALKVRTIFNIIGPLLHPGGLKRQGYWRV